MECDDWGERVLLGCGKIHMTFLLMFLRSPAHDGAGGPGAGVDNILLGEGVGNNLLQGDGTSVFLIP